MPTKKRPRPAPEAAAAAAPPQPLASLSGLAFVSLAYDAGEEASDAFTGVFLQPAAGDAHALTVLFTGAPLSDDQLVGAFADCGEVAVTRRGAFAAGGATFAGAALRFGTPRGARRALARGSAFPVAAGGGGERAAAPQGLRAWLGALEDAKVDQRALQRAVDGHMAAFDAAEGAKTAAVAALATRMEADGFTLVTKGRKPRLEDDVPAAAAPAAESDNQKRKRKRGSVVVGDFYAFQAAGRKASSLEELRRRFEEDKERVRRIKEARAFKPY